MGNEAGDEMAGTPVEALRAILPSTGRSTDALSAVRFTGGADPVLPTPFRIGAAGTAAIAAAGVAAASLWEQQTGRRQEIAVDVRQATAALRSGRYMKCSTVPCRTKAILSWASIRPGIGGGFTYIRIFRTTLPRR